MFQNNKNNKIKFNSKILQKKNQKQCQKELKNEQQKHRQNEIQREQQKQHQKVNQIGNTIAVLGCGIDKLYPSQNKELAKWILRTGGCIISEYPNGTNPNKENFPQRNRIISGLSDGVLVVEAGEKSGAVITANIALEQGKEVFAVPGNINSPQSMGTNKLIFDGAKIVTDINDILE